MIFPFKIPFKKCFKIVVFPLWRRDPVLELRIAAISGAVARNPIVFCNSVSADCGGMAASRFLAAAVASVILLCFASESRKSHCDGSAVKVANGALAATFFQFGIDDFPFKIPFKKCFKIVVFPLWRRDPVLELRIAAISGAVARNAFVFCNSASADCSGMVASRFLAAAAAHDSLRMVLWQQLFFILALMIFLLKFLLKSASKSSFFRFGVAIRFWSCESLQLVEPLHAILLCFATQCPQIAVEWLHQGSLQLQLQASYYCVLHLRVVSRIVMVRWKLPMVLWQQLFFQFGIDDFPFKIPFKKCFKIVVFPLWRRDPVLELRIAAICGAVARNAFVLCNSVSADCSGMAASRFLAAAVASVILFCFASESCESHCNGSVKVANGVLAATFFHFGIDDFPFKIAF